jgi:hypothetical protein
MTPQEAITQAGSKGKWNVNKHIAAKAAKLYAESLLIDAINLINNDINEQEAQLSDDLKGLTTLERIDVGYQAEAIRKKIKGMRQAIHHLENLYLTTMNN